MFKVQQAASLRAEPKRVPGPLLNARMARHGNHANPPCGDRTQLLLRPYRREKVEILKRLACRKCETWAVIGREWGAVDALGVPAVAYDTLFAVNANLTIRTSTCDWDSATVVWKSISLSVAALAYG